jgi:PncC family amidohydrolase
MFEELLPLAEQVASLLRERQHTIAIAESSTAGLVSAALLAVPGASAYFLGGAVVYTRQARSALLGLEPADLGDVRPSTEAYALLLARRARERFGATWALGESGASGPTGNRYGDAAGHCCLAISGPQERAQTLETGQADRLDNMRIFAEHALRLLHETLA